jgi:hypothetical protein
MNELRPPLVCSLMRKPLLLLLTILAAAAPAGAAVVDELGAADRAKLESGQSVMTTIEKPGATWPEVRI